MRKCRFCAMEIPTAARVCPHCRRDLIPGQSTAQPDQKVTITGVDPFAAYHTPIQGKKAGNLTVIGHLGVGLGVFIVLGGMVALFTVRAGQEGGAFLMLLIGVLVSVASYLWVRR